MSLVSLGVRLIAARLLQNQTLAENQIQNSPIDPLSDWDPESDEASKPWIVIYSTERDLKVNGRQTGGTMTKLKVAFNIALPPEMVVFKDENGEDMLTVKTGDTGGAMVLDIVARQIERAFHFGDQAWLDVWNKFVFDYIGVESRALVYEIKKVIEVPVLSVVYTLSCIPEPPFGNDPTIAWSMLIAQMRTEPEYEGVAGLIESLIAEPGDLANWEKVRHSLGWSEDDAKAAGVASVSDEDPVLITDIDNIIEDSDE